MSILTFLDTVYDTVQHSQRYGGPAQLFNNQDKYKFQTLRYPLDVGSADKGHYMVFNINVQNKSNFYFDDASLSGQTSSFSTQLIKQTIQERGQINLGGAVQTAVTSFDQLKQQFPTITNTVSDIGEGINSWAKQNLPNSQELISGFTGSISGAIKSIDGQNFLRTTKRSSDAIALYMPDTLNFEYRQTFEELSLSKGVGGLATAAAAAGQSLVDSYKAGGVKAVGQNLAPFAASFTVGQIGDFGKALTAAGFGVVQNPMIEMLYSQPNLRTFQFDFMFYPRDEKEAFEVQNILDRFRFHQAPEIKSYSGGYFLVPPSEFDIQFYYNGKINPNIDKIATCVLENMIVNYAPSGFTAYESLYEGSPSMGRTGMPVAIQLTLMFKETQVMTKEKFAIGNRSVGPLSQL